VVSLGSCGRIAKPSDLRFPEPMKVSGAIMTGARQPEAGVGTLAAAMVTIVLEVTVECQ
jgi:hypothetical protein